MDLSDVYKVDQFIDTFALGHYARVLDATDRRTGASVAFKVMRPEHLATGTIKWEYRAFISEAEILMRLADSPQVIRLLDCGYISDVAEAPASGEIISFGTQVKLYATAMEDYAARGWRPYLTLEHLPRTHSLMYVMKPNRADVRWRLPSEEGIALAMQFANFLKLAHSQGVAYLDHKLEHVYWDGAGLRVIDFNSSRMMNGDNGDSQYIRMDIHSLCVGILYPLFTGLSPLKTSLKPQPSSAQEVEARYQDIQTLDFGVEPTLSPSLRELIQLGAQWEFSHIDDFIDELRIVAELHGWDFPNSTIPTDCRVARDNMRQGLRKLREGHDAIRAARDLFRDAAVLDGITQDLENELRRLVKATNDMLNERVIP